LLVFAEITNFICQSCVFVVKFEIRENHNGMPSNVPRIPRPTVDNQRIDFIVYIEFRRSDPERAIKHWRFSVPFGICDELDFVCRFDDI